MKNLEFAMKNTFELKSPHYWRKQKLTVIRDGYDPDTGQRIHIVKELLEEQPTLIANALVFTKGENL